MPVGPLLALALVAAVTPAEPRRLAEVSIESPDAEPARWRRYLELGAGDLLDPAELRRAIRLLHATGRFADVIAETSGPPEATRLLLRLRPAPLMLAVRALSDEPISESRVRRVAGLQEGEPLWRARLDRAARDVALDLVQDGYLEARTRAEAVPLPGGAEALFHVTPGPRARVSSVEVVAPELGSAAVARLRDQARPGAGDVFRRLAAEEAGASMQQSLAREGRWRARVDVVETYDPEHARVALTFDVDPGPAMRVEIQGEPVPGGARSQVEQRLREGRADDDAVAESVDLLEEALRARGFRNAVVRPREEPLTGRSVVILALDPGPRSLVASLSLAGAEGLRLDLPGIAGSELVPGEPLRDASLSEVRSRLLRELHALGYVDARVDSEAPDRGGSVPVLFRVAPGPRVTVAEVRVDGGIDAVQPELPLVAGQPYRLSDVAASRDALVAALRDAGYPQAAVDPVASFSEDQQQAQVTLRVRPGPLIEVDRIVVAGLDQTREEVVRRELLLEEGEPLGAQELLESQRRLSELGIFQQVSIRELDPARPGRRSLVVTASEAPRTVLSYGLGYSERDLLRGSLEATRRNLFGRARSLTAFARIGFRGSRFLATYREPWLFGRRQELFLTAFREDEEREAFDFERYGGLVQSALNLGPHWSLIGRYSYRRTQVFEKALVEEPIDKEFTNSTFSGPSLSLIRDTRDDPLDPSGGGFFGADAQLSASRLGGDSFVKGFAQLAAYRRLAPRIVVAVSGRLGLSTTFGEEAPEQLPLPDRFFAGGAYSLRGFAVDAVDETGGNALLLTSLELRIGLAAKLSLGAFADMGNVYPLVSEIDLGDQRYAVGIGLRYRSPFGPLRVDWGYKLNRRDDEPRFRFHFAVGHAF